MNLSPAPSCIWGYASVLDFSEDFNTGQLSGCTFSMPAIGGTCNGLLHAEMQLGASISIKPDHTCVLGVGLSVQAVTVFGANNCTEGIWDWQVALPDDVPANTTLTVPRLTELQNVCVGTIPQVSVTFP